ncbi:hypothetical protein [Nitrosopumilus sp.]|uniref:hypothetical protein n=1 Tax=Nitrosopumilus sp. TaxID=2024843 RepID=UPI003D14DF45
MEKKTDVMSIRVNEKIKEKISKEADSKNMTVNTLVNQIITNHVEEGTVFQDLDFTSVRKQLLKKLFNSMPKEEVTKMAGTMCKEFFKDTTMYLYGKYDLESTVRTLESWFNSSNIPFKEIKSEDSIKMVIRHRLGSNWAMYFETMIKAVLEELEVKTDSYVKTIDSFSFRAYY